MKFEWISRKTVFQTFEWWHAHGEMPPVPDIIPENNFGAFSDDGVLLCMVSVIMTDAPALVWLDNFVGNPVVERSRRREASKRLFEHVQQWCIKRGKSRLFCMSLADKEKVSHYYETELGWTPTAKVQCFALRLTEE